MALAHWIFAGSRNLEIGEYSVSIQGHRMLYFRAGSGPEMVILHGLLGAAACWLGCMSRFSEHATVFAPDALGIGGSDRVADLDASLAGHAERLAEFFDAAGIAAADLVASSHGGAVALQFAAMYPERVRSLTLQAPANPFSDMAEPRIRFFTQNFGQRVAHLIPRMPRAVLSLALGRMYADSRRIVPGSLDRYMASLAVAGTVPHLLNILRAWSDDMRRLEMLLPRVSRIPTLLLWGSDDRAVSLASAQKLMGILENARLAVLPQTGHLPYEEDLDAFCGEVEKFLRGQTKKLRPARPHLVHGTGETAWA
jgi:pimeloyl-ACP methyl ester carboxylesterase